MFESGGSVEESGSHGRTSAPVMACRAKPPELSQVCTSLCYDADAAWQDPGLFPGLVKEVASSRLVDLLRCKLLISLYSSGSKASFRKHSICRHRLCEALMQHPSCAAGQSKHLFATTFIHERLLTHCCSEIHGQELDKQRQPVRLQSSCRTHTQTVQRWS